MNLRVNIINLSEVIGGQEIYLSEITTKIESVFNIKMFVNLELWEKNNLFNNTKIQGINIYAIRYIDFYKIIRIIKEKTNKDDIFIFNGNRAIYLGSLLPNTYKKIAIQHSSLIDFQDGNIKSLFRNFIYSLMIKRYDKIIGVSSSAVNSILKYANVFVIRNGIDINKFFPVSEQEKRKLREQIGLSISDKVILMVGTLTANKGQIEAIKIIKKLNHEYKLVLVGDGPEKENIKKKVVDEGLVNKVLIIGQVNNIVKYYHSADVLLFLSNNEGLPLTILEAMATGLPIITTCVGGIPELIQDCENGYFIDRNDKENIVKIINMLFSNNEKMLTIRDRNIAKIKNEFTLNHCVDNLVKHINSYLL